MPTGSRILNAKVTDADADQLTEHYKRTLSRTIVEPLSARGRISVEDRHYKVDSFSTWSGMCHSGMNVEFIEPPDAYLIYLPICGTIDINIGSKKHTLNPESAFIGDFSTLERVRFHAGRGHTGIAIDKTFLVRQLSELLDAPVTRRLEFSKLLTHDSLAFKKLSAVSTLLWASLRDDPATVASTKYAELLFQTVVAVMLDAIPHNYSTDLTERTASAMPWHIKKAIEYMISNIAQPLTIGEIARETGVSIRNLQVGFQQFKGTTPLQYLRQIRLNGVRKGLVDDTDQGPISELARRWGFNHMGRFAALYCESYGELPSETTQSGANTVRPSDRD